MYRNLSTDIKAMMKSELYIKVNVSNAIGQVWQRIQSVFPTIYSPASHVTTIKGTGITKKAMSVSMRLISRRIEGCL